MYYQTPTQQFEQAGISVVIWANHLMRASITAMQDTAAAIHENRSLMPVENRIAPLKEVFRLQNVDELKTAEENLRLKSDAPSGPTQKPWTCPF